MNSMDWLKGKQVSFLRGPATVMEEFLHECRMDIGNAARMLIPSQNTCLFSLHCYLYDG